MKGCSLLDLEIEYSMSSVIMITHRWKPELGNLQNLQQQCTALENSATQCQALDMLKPLGKLEIHPTRHPTRNINVDVRYQYSPADLCMRLRTHGFRPIKIIPVHYHALPLTASADYRGAHDAIAELVENIAGDDQRMVPRSSTFIVTAKKGT